MKTRDEVIALFRSKYDYLKSVYPEVGSFDEAVSSNFYQNPDGGWQLNLSPCAAITLRPGDDEAHEIHGQICARWYEEGGAFEKDLSGWLGYPIKDQEESNVYINPPCPRHLRLWNPKPISVNGAFSEFDFGRIEWQAGLPWDRANENHDYNGIEVELYWQGIEDAYGEGRLDDAKRITDLAAEAESRADVAPDIKELVGSIVPGVPIDPVFAIMPKFYVELNESGKQHVPSDIDAAVRCILSIRNLHVTGDMTHACELRNAGRATWRFQVPTEEYNEMIANVWRDGINIRVAIDSVPKPKPRSVLDTILGRPYEERCHEEFTIPNNFKVM